MDSGKYRWSNRHTVVVVQRADIELLVGNRRIRPSLLQASQDTGLDHPRKTWLLAALTDPRTHALTLLLSEPPLQLTLMACFWLDLRILSTLSRGSCDPLLATGQAPATSTLPCSLE